MKILEKIINSVLYFKSIYLLLIIFCQSIQAQPMQLKFGIGNYEGLNIGMRHTFKKLHFEYGLGADLNVFQQGYNTNVHALLGKKLFKKRAEQPLQYYFQFKTLLWYIENPSNQFLNASFSPELMIKKKLNSDFELAAYLGFVWTTNLKYVRKTYQEIGFPREFQPGFGLQLFYKLK
ncbi:MAG: hypothetical protein Q8K70_03370 [Bacteroidota bacterium]|nr:hypothetical protein [Bacteroidota bacterium]